MSNAGQTPKGRTGKGFSIVKTGLIVLLIAILVPVLALQVPTIRQALIQSCIERIEGTTHLKILFGSSNWRLLSGLRLSLVSVLTDNRRILDCSEVDISYSLRSTWPYVNIEEVYLERPFLQLERSADGKWILPLRTGLWKREGGIGGGGPQWPGRNLPTVRISSGTIEGRQDGHVVLTVKDVTGVLRLKVVDGPDGPEIRIDLENIEAAYHSPILRAALADERSLKP